MYDNPNKQDDDDGNVVDNNNLDDNTAIQRVNHPVQDNLASRAAPLSRQKGQHETISFSLVVRHWSTGSKALVDIPTPGKRR